MVVYSESTMNAQRKLWLVVSLATSLAACTSHDGPGPHQPPMPWLQLDRASGASSASMAIEPDGTFMGILNRMGKQGTVSDVATTIDVLRRTFEESMLQTYRADVLPTNGSVDLMGG